MKRIIYIFIFALLQLASFAQGGKREKIEALRVGFITQQLNLTADESQKFWPVYNEYQDKVRAARREFKGTSTAFTSDKEAQEFLDAELLFKQRELSLYKEYYDKFKKILPLKKVAMLRQAEEEFKKELLQQLQGKSKD
ncbi:MAG: hypothetical protein ACXVC6_15495 [Bacteroidia bacterium]